MVIEGGRRLSGAVTAGGAKNAALPLLFATLLTDEPCRLTGVPEVADINTAVRLLESLGARVERPAPGEVVVDASGVCEFEAPYDLVRTMRASFLALGPLVARFGKARVSTPGGCAIGSRPVDVHVAALERLGARVRQEGGYVDARAKRLKGAHAILSVPSVGATENLLMSAALADGTTRIENAAREPEIVDLADALRKMGARIDGDGGAVVEVEGVERLGGFEHRVVADRIVAGTYLLAGAITGGEVRVRDAVGDHLGLLVDAMRAAGCRVDTEGEGVAASLEGRPKPVNVRTAPHPGFATDLQAQFMALMAVADGTAIVDERIFENRFMHVQELARMGAEIRLVGHRAFVRGRERLSGAPVMATDLRASVCLVLAGLAAEGTTEVLRIYHLDRGYQHLDERLRELGGEVRREQA